jgi:putative PEP-CTERM system histidine kinase
MLYFFLTINCALLLSGLAFLRLGSRDRQFSLALMRVLVGLPLLAAQYFYIVHYFHNYITPDLQTPIWLLFKPSVLPLPPQMHFVFFQEQLTPFILFFETVFTLLWFGIAHQLHNTLTPQSSQSKHPILTQFGRQIEIWGGLPLIVILFCYQVIKFNKIETLIRTDAVVFHPYSLFFFTDILLLTAMLFMAWRLENFWRGLSSKQRWEYKYLVIGSYVVCGALAWAASYRFMYHQLVLHHLWLLTALLMFGWVLMIYATARHRLLNRKIYISRKVVYSFIAPVAFALYLIFLGAVAFAMRLWGWEFPFVLKWLLFIIGLVALIAIAFSGKFRHQIKFFISTNFYVNKYEYRDEWLAFSRRLQGVFTETEVVKALYKVLSDSLYTLNVCIWLGNDKQGYRLAISDKNADIRFDDAYYLAPDDPLIVCFQKHQHYYRLEDKKAGFAGVPGLEQRLLVTELNLVLFMPLTIGEQMLGLIALGPEFTGGKYGTDDFDLLTALGTQTASALLAVRMAEELALAREQKAVDIMSAFILHDVKNAAGMLSLIRQNAADYMDDPEFQQDMLETIDDALKRMGKVQTGLKTLKGEITPTLKDKDLEAVLSQNLGQLKKRLLSLEIALHCEARITIETDPDLLRTILENLLLNAFEAGGNGTKVNIRCYQNSHEKAMLEISDNGPGLPSELLPDAVFEPFKTTKTKGSGIGLWQVKRIVASLNGTITAANCKSGGARFCVGLPIKEPSD